MKTTNGDENERNVRKRPYYHLVIEKDFIKIMKAFNIGIHSDICKWKGISSHDRGRTGAVIRYILANYVATAMLPDGKTLMFKAEDRELATEYLQKQERMMRKAREADFE